MATLEKYRNIVRKALTQLTEGSWGGLNINSVTVFDEAADRYLVVTVGWDGRRKRVHHITAQVDISPEGKYISRLIKRKTNWRNGLL